jgi:hypothetical protein
MAGKVLAVQEMFKPEQKVVELVRWYDTWQRQHDIKKAEWRELRNYIFATDTSKTSNSTLPWKNKTTIPKLTQIRDNLHAHYMDALFPNAQWMIWEGDDEESSEIEKVEGIEAFMRNKAKMSDFEKTCSLLLYDYIDYGNAFGEVVWADEKHIDAATGQEEQTYVGPKLERISPFDITFNPTAPNFEDSPKFVRYVKGLGELKKDIMNRPEMEFRPEALAKAIDQRSKLSSVKTEDINKSQGIAFDGFGSLSEYFQSGLVEILEFSGDYYDMDNDVLHENRIITIIDRQWILRDIANPNWFGRDNKVHVGWRERPDNLWSMGPLDNLVGLQYRLDHLENLKADALDLTILPPIVIKGDVEPFVWEPRATIHVDEDGDVQQSPPNPAALAIDNEIAYLMQTMEEMAGAPKQAMGIRTPGEKTKFEVQTLDNASQRIFLHKTNKFENLVEDALNLFLEVARRNMSTSDLSRIEDDDTGASIFVTITKKDITAKGKIRPVGSRHFAAQAQLLQNIQTLYSTPLGEMLKNHTSTKRLAALVEEAMSIQKFAIFRENVGVTELQETQQLMSQAEQTIAEEQTVPVEEELLEESS